MISPRLPRERWSEMLIESARYWRGHALVRASLRVTICGWTNIRLATTRWRIMGALPSAESRDLFGNNQMRFIRTAKMRTDALGQLLCRQQAAGFNHSLFSMHPFGFARIEPGA